MDAPLYWSTEVLRVSKFRFRLVLEVLIRPPSFEATLPLVSLLGGKGILILARNRAHTWTHPSTGLPASLKV